MANEEVFYSALHWAKKAEASAKLASELTQSGGKLIQLGFDGVMEDGVLVFKHAPGGIDTPYQLVDDVEYEIDLAYNETGDLPNLTEIAVQNGGEIIRFVSALHRDAMTNVTVADMEAVMRYNSSTGYRWLFKAAYKVTPSGAKVFLLYPVVAAKDYSDKTNCITEIPQDIKLELKDGVLTLKAGSKVYVPNGFEADGTTPKFDEVVVESDASISNRTTNTKEMLFYSIDKQAVNLLWLSDISSGTTQPTGHQYMIWYDTANNLCKFTKDSGVTWEKYSLPVSLVTVSSTQITSIDQVFNGFGYIGSTMWVNKGVKGLIPNGRNADGSLNNIEFVTPKFIIREAGLHANAPLVCLLKGDYFYIDYTTDIVYNAEQNLIYKKGNVDQILPFATYYSGDTISNFSPKTTFHAVDYNEASGLGMPSSKYINLTLGANNTRYTAPANGWVMFRALTTTTNRGYGLSCIDSGLRSFIRVDNSGSAFGTYIPVVKNNIFELQYEGDVSGAVFRFIYAEGDK